jgi:hypothetical protein
VAKLAAFLPTPCGCANGGVIESSAFEWGAGTGFKIYLIVTEYSGFAVFTSSSTSMEGTYFWWLEDPVVIDGPSSATASLETFSISESWS